MTFDGGLNARATSGFAVDGANETYFICQSDTYDTNRGGFDFGVVDPYTGTQYQQRDRDAGLDRRLAGVMWNSDSVTHDVRFNVPATGSYTIHLAMGDPSSTQTLQIDVRDGNGSLFTIGATVVLSGRTMDATGTVYTDANWPASETGVLITLSTPYVLLRLAAGNVTVQSMLQHVRLVQSASATVALGYMSALSQIPMRAGPLGLTRGLVEFRSTQYLPYPASVVVASAGVMPTLGMIPMMRIPGGFQLGNPPQGSTVIPPPVVPATFGTSPRSVYLNEIPMRPGPGGFAKFMGYSGSMSTVIPSAAAGSSGTGYWTEYPSEDLNTKHGLFGDPSTMYPTLKRP